MRFLNTSVTHSNPASVKRTAQMGIATTALLYFMLLHFILFSHFNSSASFQQDVEPESFPCTFNSKSRLTPVFLPGWNSTAIIRFTFCVVPAISWLGSFYRFLQVQDLQIVGKWHPRQTGCGKLFREIKRRLLTKVKENREELDTPLS